MTILWNNDWWAELESRISILESKINDYVNQLSQQNPSTLEWSQAIGVLNDRIALYQNALSQYQWLLSNIKSSATEAKRWSAMKEQGRKWYIQWLATKRWMTHAEAMKDIADVSSTWAAERSDIRSQELQNLGSAQWWLSNMYMTMAEQQASLDALKPSWWTSSWWTSSSKWYKDYVDAAKGSGKTDEDVQNVFNQEVSNEWKSNQWGRVAVWAWVLWAGLLAFLKRKQIKKAWFNLFKKII